LKDFKHWHKITGLPILLADASVPRRRPSLKEYKRKGTTYEGHGEKYASMMDDFFEAPFMLGWHYCGAYMENKERRFGLLNRFDEPNKKITIHMRIRNHEIQKKYRWSIMIINF